MSYLKKYEYVIAVDKYGGISVAAEKLGISQPTFSKYLKKIESELGVELFDRSTLPIKLTSAGECFVSAGKKLIDVDRQLRKQLDEIKSQDGAVVRVGISPSRSPYTMPSVIELYRRKNGKARVVIEERTTAELCKRLNEGELDLVVSILDKNTESFDRIELFEESVLLAVPASLAENSISAEELLATSTIISVGKGQVMWQTLNSIIEDMNLPCAKIECQSIESALSMVRRGLGVTLVPSYISREQDGKIRFLPLKQSAAEKNKRKICIFYRKEQFLTRAEKEFIDCLVESERKEK